MIYRESTVDCDCLKRTNRRTMSDHTFRELCQKRSRLPTHFFPFISVNEAAKEFFEKLAEAHNVVCPWQKNPCSPDLILIPRNAIPTMVTRFNERYHQLLQLPFLPKIPVSAVEKLGKDFPALLRKLLESPHLFPEEERPEGENRKASPFLQVKN